MSATSACGSPSCRSGRTALAVHGRRSAGGQRLCGARRLHLHHARHPAVSRQRSRAGRRARPRDRPRHGAALGAAVHAQQSAGTLLLAASASSCPRAAVRPASEQALGVLFLKYGRDDELQADQLGATYEVGGGWDPAGVPGHALDARPPGRSGRRSQGRAELAVHAPRSAPARGGDPAGGPAAQGRPPTRTSSPIATRCSAASTA